MTAGHATTFENDKETAATDIIVTGLAGKGFPIEINEIAVLPASSPRPSN